MNPVPTHLSFSTLMTWERCPHKYLLEKVAEAPQRPAVYFAGGTAVHLMTEALDTGQAPPGAKFEDYFYPEVERLMETNDRMWWDHKTWLSGNDTLDDWLELGPKMVKAWEDYASEPSMNCTAWIEEDVTGTLPACPVPIKGFIDRIGYYNAEWMILDIKTGKSKPKDRFQLETYSALFAMKTEPHGHKLAYFMARDGKVTKPETAQMSPIGVGQRYGKAYAEMVEAAETGEYPAKREFSCKWCPVQDSCLAWAGDTKMAKQNDPYYAQGKPVY